MDKAPIYMGYWWLPGKEDQKIAGNFIYNLESQSYKLRLLGKFQNNKNEPLFYNDYKMIIGLAKDDFKNKNFSFKLLNAFVTKAGPGNYYEIIVNDFLICPGEEFSDNLDFNYAFLKVTYLDEWFANSGFNIDNYSETKFGYQVEYRKPDDIILYESEEFIIKGIFQASIDFPLYTDFKAGQSALLLLEFKNQQHLSTIKKKAIEIKNFFCLAIGLPLRFESFQLERQLDDSRFHKFTYKYKEQSKKLVKRNIRSFGMPLDFKKHHPQLQIIFQKWFKFYEDFVLSVLNFFGVINDMSGFEEDKFLNLVIAIETYQRKRYPDFRIKNEKFLEIRNRVLSQIQSKNDNQWLSKHLKKNSPTRLKDRFNFILNNHKQSLDGLINDQEKFIDHVVETRHHLVHEEVKSMHLVLKGGEKISSINSKLKIILEAVFLYELGFEPKLINEKIKSNQYNFQAFEDIRF